MSKGKRFLLIALVITALTLSCVACDSADNVPDTGADDTFDELIEGAADGYSEGLSTLCNLCQLSGDDDCSGVCR